MSLVKGNTAIIGSLALASSLYFSNLSNSVSSSYPHGIASEINSTKEKIYYQLSGKKLIPTEIDIVKNYKNNGCKEIVSDKGESTSIIYLADNQILTNNETIPTDNFLVLSEAEIDKIKKSPDCK